MYHVLENTFVCVDRFHREKTLVVVINYHLARKLLIDLCLTIEANMPGCTHGFDPKILHCRTFYRCLGLEPGKSMKTQAHYSNMVVEFPYIGPTSIKLVHKWLNWDMGNRARTLRQITGFVLMILSGIGLIFFLVRPRVSGGTLER